MFIPFSDSVSVEQTLYDCIEDGFKGIVCMECALGYHGICTYNFIDNPMFYAKAETLKGMHGGMIGYLFVPEIDSSNIQVIKSGVYVTSKERTICDMIRYNGDIFHLLEALNRCYDSSWSNNGGVDIELLELLVDEYGIRDEFDKLKVEAMEL